MPVDAKDYEDKTALQWAALEGQEKIAGLLLSEGALIDEKNNDGKTALQFAAGRPSIVALLQVAGAQQ